MYRIYDIAPSDFKNDFNNAVKLIHLDDQYKIHEALKKHLAGQSCTVEFRIPQKDGTDKFVIGKGEPLFDENGRVVGILGTAQDITENKILEQKLKKAHKMLARAQSLARTGSWEMDLFNYKIYWSDEACRIYGFPRDQYCSTYKSFLEFVHPDDVEIIENMIESRPDKPVELEFRFVRPDGSVRNIYQLMEFEFNKEGNPVYIYGTIQDITEKKQMQEEVERRQEKIINIQKRFHALIKESSDVFEILDSDGTILYMSEASEKVIGYKPEERMGKKVYEYYEGAELQKVIGMMDRILKNPDQKIQEDVILKTRTGKGTYLEVQMQNLLHDPAVKGIVVNLRDITGRIEMEKELDYISKHDELTGLPNRIYFKQRLMMLCEHARETQTGFAVMMLDIDRFKYINDVLGYQIGDELIIEAAKRLRDNLGDGNFICRYSGDRFAVIMEELTTIKECEKVSKTVTELLTQTFRVHKYELHLTVSMGISIYTGTEQNPDLLVKHAEIALFWAKSEGKNRYKFYSTNINIPNYKQFELRNDLVRAIERHQFRICFQPQVNLRNGDILAAEALIRWQHPKWGMVSPGEFISLAEETGFIINMGKWMLKEVCRSFKQWQDKGLPKIKVSVNFSSVQFFESNFVENIKNIIDEFELDPHFLIMEITESVLIKNADKVIRDIQKLQSLGIQIALDDFGTGFSALAYLSSFNIDIIKIDHSFINNIILDKTSAVITKNIINMAEELKIKIVAEGIENWEQLSYLRKLNCYAGQGYVYGEPVPLEDFEKILARGRCKPVLVKEATDPYENRREYFRIEFHRLLEADMTIVQIRGREITVDSTKVLIKDISAGGLRFITDIDMLDQKDIILLFKIQLIENEIKLQGHFMWMEDMDNDLYQYGVEFKIDEMGRTYLIKILNQIQVKMRNDILFTEGSFITQTPVDYFTMRNAK